MVQQKLLVSLVDRSSCQDPFTTSTKPCHRGNTAKSKTKLVRVPFCLLASVARGWYRVISDLGIRRSELSWLMEPYLRPSLAWIQIPDFTPMSLSILVLFWNARSSCSKSTKANSDPFPFHEAQPQFELWPSTEAQLQGLKLLRPSSC